LDFRIAGNREKSETLPMKLSVTATKSQCELKMCQTSVWITSSSLPWLTPPAPPEEAPIMALLAFPKLKAMTAANIGALSKRTSPSQA
jgi:hypothetical protein